MSRSRGALTAPPISPASAPGRLREDSLRRVADAQGLLLQRSAFDVASADRWWLIDPNLRAVVYPPNAAAGVSVSLDQVEAWLRKAAKPMTKQHYILWRSSGLNTAVGRPHREPDGATRPL